MISYVKGILAEKAKDRIVVESGMMGIGIFVPGLGQAAVTAGLGSDIPLLMGITLISAVLVFAGNAAADGLYRLVDPRLRKGGRA